MKRLFLFLMLISLFNACKKDPCEATNCQNDGICIDGTCDCPQGWAGTNCEISTDPCLNITCTNGGNCVNGSCICPPQWTGPDCSLQLTPTKMILNKITIIKFPAMNGGVNWDLFDGIDLKFIYGTTNPSTTLFTSSTFENATFGNNYVWNTNIEINDVTDEHAIWLYDDDGISADDFVEGISFTPYYNSTNGFPTIVNISFTGSLTAYTFEYSYQW